MKENNSDIVAEPERDASVPIIDSSQHKETINRWILASLRSLFITHLLTFFI